MEESHLVDNYDLKFVFDQMKKILPNFAATSVIDKRRNDFASIALTTDMP